MAENDLGTSTSSTFPMMPTQDTVEWPTNSIYSDNHDEIAEEHPRSTEKIPGNNHTTANIPEDGNETVETTERQFTSPLPSSPVGCSTDRTAHKPVHGNSATPPGPIKRKGNFNLEVDSQGRELFVRFEEGTNSP